MSDGSERLSDRSWSFWVDRLHWLDQEITRYRDFEWKATSFHSAFYVALLYALLNKDSRPVLQAHVWWLAIAVGGYTIISISQLVYIHVRLNASRNRRGVVLTKLGQESPAPITRMKGYWEGTGAIFPVGFMVSLLFLAIADLVVLFSA